MALGIQFTITDILTNGCVVMFLHFTVILDIRRTLSRLTSVVGGENIGDQICFSIPWNRDSRIKMF